MPAYLLLQLPQQVLVVEGLGGVTPHAVPAVPRLCSSLGQEHTLVHTQAPVWLC